MQNMIEKEKLSLLKPFPLNKQCIYSKDKIIIYLKYIILYIYIHNYIYIIYSCIYM